MQDISKKDLQQLAKETKSTNRLFRINQSIYLFKGKFYKSDVFNMAFVVAKVKPSTTHLTDVCSFFEITDQSKLKTIYNV